MTASPFSSVDVGTRAEGRELPGLEPAPWVEALEAVLDLAVRHPAGWVVMILIFWGMFILTIKVWRRK